MLQPALQRLSLAYNLHLRIAPDREQGRQPEECPQTELSPAPAVLFHRFSLCHSREVGFHGREYTEVQSFVPPQVKPQPFPVPPSLNPAGADISSPSGRC